MPKSFLLIQAVVILAIISICTVFLTIIIPIHDSYSQQQRQQLPINAIFKMAANSTVGIITSPTESNVGSNFEFDGTGFVYDAGGEIPYIVTNAHVVQDVQDYEPVGVIFTDGRIHTAEIKGVDRQGDIAVLQIIWNATSQRQSTTPLTIGNSSELQVGEQVIAIGNSFIGDQSFANLLTTGVISKLGVEAAQIDAFEKGPSSIINSIVTDAATVEGNSGGPLLNLKGEVVGMNTAGDDNMPCCTYAIPSNTIKHIVPTLIETGEYFHPWIGFAPLTLHVGGQSGGLIPSNIQGIIVSNIDMDGPAYKAGLKASTINQFDEIEIVGDIITALDGEAVTTADQLNAYIDEHKLVGDNVVLAVYRNGQTLNLGLTLEKNPLWSNNSTSTSGILTYQNSSYGTTIQHPANWTEDEGDFDPNDGVTNIVEFNSPRESRLDSYQETLGLSIEELTDQNMTLKEYAASLITDYKGRLTDFNLIESNTNSVLAAKPAYKLVYINREDNTNYKTMEIGTIIGDKVYYIEYTAEEDKYSNYLPIIQMMINSFEIT